VKFYDIQASFMIIWEKPVPADKFRQADKNEGTVRRLPYAK
jgi:hypothetical protein